MRRPVASLSDLIASKNWPAVVSVLDETSQVNESLNPKQLDSALWSLCSSKKISLAYKLFLKAPDFALPQQEQHYTALIECAIRAEKPILAANIFYQSQVFGVTLDAAVLNELMLALVKAGAGMRNVRYVFEVMTRDLMLPTAPICLRILKICSRSGDWAFAEDVLQVMHQHKYELPRKFIESILSAAEKTEGFQSFQRVWQLISDPEEAEEGGDAGLREEEMSMEHKKADPLRVPKDHVKLPLSFQLVLMPNIPTKDTEGFTEDLTSEEEDADSDDDKSE